MRKLNGAKFYEEPGSCGTCPFLLTGTTQTPIYVPAQNTGHCIMFDESHKVWRSVPRRCAKLFKKLFEYPDGCELVIVANISEK